MRVLLALMVAAAALWSGYWALAARGIEHGLSGWVEARRADGWAADVGTIEVHGFPARFDSAITDLALADPQTGLAWSVPELRIESRSTKPHHFRVIWPETQQIATEFRGAIMPNGERRP